MSEQIAVSPQREAKEIVTAHGHKVQVKTYLTGRESDQYKRVMFEKTKVKMVKDPNVDPAAGDGKQIVEQSTEMDGTIIFEQQEAARQICVISLDADSNNLLERLKELPSEDYEEINNACAVLVKSTFRTVKA